MDTVHVKTEIHAIKAIKNFKSQSLLIRSNNIWSGKNIDGNAYHMIVSIKCFKSFKVAPLVYITQQFMQFK